MDRRTFGVLAVGAVTGLTGCPSLGTTTSDPETTTQTLPEPVESVGFSVTAKSENDPAAPTIAYLQVESQVRISGTLYSGTPCYETRLESLSYDEESDALTATVDLEQVRTSCPDSLGTSTYEIRVSFQSALPESVTARHRDYFDETETTSVSATEITPTGLFDDFAVETEQTWCPSDEHWQPAYHRTPQFPPDRPSNITRETAISYARSYEEHVLTYVAVSEHGPQTPPTTVPGEPEVLEFPEREMWELTAQVIAAFEDAFVVRITYTRVIEGESEGTYTVNYYVSPEQTIRAETEGTHSPGPNPAKEGMILEC